MIEMIVAAQDNVDALGPPAQLLVLVEAHVSNAHDQLRTRLTQRRSNLSAHFHVV